MPTNIVPSGVPNANTDPALQAFDALAAVKPLSASGAVGITEGFCAITATSAAALTLAQAPTGLPSAGGEDGQRILFIDTTGHAHTVTTPASGIAGGKHVATFNGTVGSSIEFIAYQGVWYVVGTASGVTLS
jgi:hypothetical protein